MNRHSYRSAATALWQTLCQRFVAALPPQHHARMGIVVAVSGGADSVALLRLIAQLWQEHPDTDARQLIVAHYNHGTRGADSDKDERFVAQLAHSLGLDFVTQTRGRADARRDHHAPQELPARGDGPSASEQSLRQLRYDFLAATVAARGARYVLTAHTADDQVETVLHHLLRGTGPVGLCGIPPARTFGDDFVLLRPLLNFGRLELRTALAQLGQAWREDQSNENLDYQRNWIRGELLPLIRSRYAAADDAIVRLVNTQSQWHQTLRSQAQRWLDEQAVFGDDFVSIKPGMVEPAVFGLAVTLIWDRLGWPRQALAAEHYHRIAELIAGQQTMAVTLPGAILARSDDAGRVRIDRSTIRKG